MVSILSFFGKIKLTALLGNIAAVTGALSMPLALYLSSSYFTPTVTNITPSNIERVAEVQKISAPVYAPYNDKQSYTVIIVNSYDRGHICSDNQRQGVLDNLWLLKKSKNLDVREYYIEGLTLRKDTTSQKVITDRILDVILKKPPNVVILIGPIAFEYLARPLGNRSIDVVAVGVPCYDCYENLIETPPYNKMVISFTNTRINNFLDIVDKDKIKIHHYYILSDKSIPSFYVTKGITIELDKRKIKYTQTTITTIEHLRIFLRELPSSKSGIFITLRSVKDENGNNISVQSLFDEFQYYNQRHLEIDFNPRLVKVGYAIAIGSNSYKVGSIAAEYLVTSVLGNKKLTPMVFHSPQIRAANSYRLRQLGFVSLANNINDYFTEIEGKYDADRYRH